MESQHTHAPIVERSMRVLALHGAPCNSNIMRFHSAMLKKAVGKNVEWIVPEGPEPWEPVPGATALNFSERTELEKKLAKDLPFVQWYSHPLDQPEADPDVVASWEDAIYVHVEESLEYLDTVISKEGPFDVVVAYSQSGTLLAIYQEKLAMPTIFVPGGLADAWGVHGLMTLPLQYSDLMILDHQDGHGFPTKPPRATEIYQRIVVEMRAICGLPPM